MVLNLLRHRFHENLRSFPQENSRVQKCSCITESLWDFLKFIVDPEFIVFIYFFGSSEGFEIRALCLLCRQFTT
jgi:hypothetical protein